LLVGSLGFLLDTVLAHREFVPGCNEAKDVGGRA